MSAYDPLNFAPLRFHTALAAFRSGEDTPRAYLERCLETIAAREPTVRAWVVLNESGARAQADASTSRWRDGHPLSPIDGMPIGIKDLLETRDMPTQMGCVAYAGNFPRRDNAAVWALREAGAIILGKTVTAELGGSHPGPTTNPFDPARTPGGSSSGSAAAVAACMVPAAIGTQVGGSVIRPASYCANWALKPSQGAINRGERQATSMSTHGVHASRLVRAAIPAAPPCKVPLSRRRRIGLLPWVSCKPKVGQLSMTMHATRSRRWWRIWPRPASRFADGRTTPRSNVSSKRLSERTTWQTASPPGRIIGRCGI
jgi:hypothetical protein